MDNQKWSLRLMCFAIFFISASSADFLIRQKITDAEYNNSTNLKTNLGVTSVLRDERPSSQILTIESFSVVKNRGEAYESSVFEAIGYQWTLVLYARGKRDDGGADHVSLYVKIKPTDGLPSGWEVYVDLKLFVYNQMLNKFLTVTDGTTKKYNDKQREWGFGQLIPLSTFYDTNEGYIVDDTCSFGAEIVKPIEQQQKVTFISNPPDNIFTWKIPHFSNLADKFYYTKVFLIGDRYWKLGFNPKGFGGKRNALPLYLFAQEFKSNALATSTRAQAYLRIKNQINSNHKQRIVAAWYPSWSGRAVGVRDLILFKDLNDASKGYLLNDVIILEVEMIKVSVTNMVPI